FGAVVTGPERPLGANRRIRLTTRYPLDSPPSPSPPETPLARRSASVHPAQFVRRLGLAARLSIAATPSGFGRPAMGVVPVCWLGDAAGLGVWATGEPGIGPHCRRCDLSGAPERSVRRQ